MNHHRKLADTGRLSSGKMPAVIDVAWGLAAFAVAFYHANQCASDPKSHSGIVSDGFTGVAAQSLGYGITYAGGIIGVLGEETVRESGRTLATNVKPQSVVP